MASAIDADLDAAGTVLPIALNLAATFFPPLKPFVPVIMQVLPTVLEAVKTIVSATGASPTQAAAAVAAHLTPGLPNSPALSGTAPKEQVWSTPQQGPKSP